MKVNNFFYTALKYVFTGNTGKGTAQQMPIWWILLSSLA